MCVYVGGGRGREGQTPSGGNDVDNGPRIISTVFNWLIGPLQHDVAEALRPVSMTTSWVKRTEPIGIQVAKTRTNQIKGNKSKAKQSKAKQINIQRRIEEKIQ